MTRPFLRNAATLMFASMNLGCSYDSAMSYSPPPTPVTADGLWTASAVAPAILGVAPAQLVAGGNTVPSIAISTPSAHLSAVNGVAFDSDGTLWVTSAVDSVLIAFSPAALASSGQVAASRRLASAAGSLSAPSSVAFDAQHRLWVANLENGTIVRFDRAQLGASGAPVPSVIISTGGHPASIAFDADGGLWASGVRINMIVKYGAAQLTQSGSPVPETRITVGGTSLVSPNGIAFDAAGNLWVADGGHQTLIEFTAAQQAAGGGQTPHIVLALAPPAVSVPTGLTFDADGSLWVMSEDGRLARFAQASLAESGAPHADTRLVLTGYGLLWSAAIWPIPAALPIN